MRALYRITPPAGGYLGRSRQNNERLQTIHESHRRFDRLYGCLYTTELFEKLSGLPLIRDMRGKAQSSVPNQFTVTGDVCSTYEHNAGAAYLAEVLLAARPRMRRIVPLLPVLLLLHDAGGPPFRHFTELIMQEVLGYGHEEILPHYFDSRDGELITRWTGCTPELIKQVFHGEHPFYGPLLASSLDLDSLDNVPRFLLSKGLDWKSTEDNGHRLNGCPPQEWFEFDPRRVAAGYRLVKGQICLDESVLPHVRGYGWQRQLLYDHVLFRHHGSAQAMLTRALQLAYEKNEISAEFFRFSDEQAARYLLERTSRPVRTLLGRLFRLEPYRGVCVHRHIGHLIEGDDSLDSFLQPQIAKLKRPMASSEIADIVANHLNIPRHDVAVNVQAKDRRFKELTLPIVNSRGKLRRCVGAEYLYENSLNVGIYRTEPLRIDVFLYGKHRLDEEAEDDLQGVIAAWLHDISKAP